MPSAKPDTPQDSRAEVESHLHLIYQKGVTDGCGTNDRSVEVVSTALIAVDAYVAEQVTAGKHEMYEGGEKKFVELLTVNGGVTFAESLNDDCVLFRVPKETIKRFFAGKLEAKDMTSMHISKEPK